MSIILRWWIKSFCVTNTRRYIEIKSYSHRAQIYANATSEQYCRDLDDRKKNKHPCYDTARELHRLLVGTWPSTGMTKAEVAFFLSLTAFVDILARLLLPTLFDKFGWKKRMIFWVFCLLVGTARSGNSFIKSIKFEYYVITPLHYYIYFLIIRVVKSE